MTYLCYVYIFLLHFVSLVEKSKPMYTSLTSHKYNHYMIWITIEFDEYIILSYAYNILALNIFFIFCQNIKILVFKHVPFKTAKYELIALKLTVWCIPSNIQVDHKKNPSPSIIILKSTCRKPLQGVFNKRGPLSSL